MMELLTLDGVSTCSFGFNPVATRVVVPRQHVDRQQLPGFELFQVALPTAGSPEQRFHRRMNTGKFGDEL